MQTRIRVTYKFEPAGDEKVPARYQLIRTTEYEARRTDRELWRLDIRRTLNYTREPVAEFTRRQLAELIADGTDWLAYDGKDG